MKQHAVPQEIMSVEFNLFGSMNIRQFGYVAGAGALGYFSYLILPGFLRWIGAGICILIGLAFAFAPGFDEMAKNFVLILKRPTRRVWKKDPNPPDFLLDVPIKSYKSGHVEEYTGADKGQKGAQVYTHRAKTGEIEKEVEEVDKELEQLQKEVTKKDESQGAEVKSGKVSGVTNEPNLVNGVVLDVSGNPVPDALLVVQDSLGKSVLAVKANSRGVFLSSKPLPLGKYTLNYVENEEIIASEPVVVNGGVLPYIKLQANS